jgi:DNA-binding transcriptional LysR family regulator
MAAEILDGVAVFVEAVEAGSFSGAAGRLNLTRSAIGKAVARLEARLAARLFHRTTRSLALTEDGQAFYERCRRALAEIRSAEEALDSGKREIAGKLRITLPSLFGRLVAAPVLTTFVRAHPGLELELSFTDRAIDLIADGFDLAIRNGPLGHGDGLIARRLADQRMAVYAAPAYLNDHGTPQSLDDLAHHHGVHYGRGGISKGWLFPQADGSQRQALPPARLRLDDLDVMADAAVSGLGLVWLPCWLARRHVASGALIRILAHLPQLALETHLLWPKNPHMPIRQRAVIDALVAGLSVPIV